MQCVFVNYMELWQSAGDISSREAIVDCEALRAFTVGRVRVSALTIRACSAFVAIGITRMHITDGWKSRSKSETLQSRLKSVTP